MGSVLLEFSTSDAPESSKRLAPFELYRQPLIILGISDGSQILQEIHTESEQENGSSSSNLFTDVLDRLKEEHGAALIYKILVFDVKESQTKSRESIVHVPEQNKSPSTTLKTIICDIVADFLEELSFYARSVQALPNVETPTSQSLPTPSESSSEHTGHNKYSQPNSGRSSPIASPKENGRSPHRASMPAHVLSPLSMEIANASMSSKFSSPVSESKTAAKSDDMPAERPASSSFNRHDRQVSVQGFGSGTVSEKARNQARGRLGIVVGSMYLLAGRWSEAIKELAENAITAKWSNDHAWFAKALDNILVGLLMCGWAGIEVEIPQICYPGEKPPWSFRSIKAVEGNRVAALRVLSQLLPDLTNQILHYYGRAASSSLTDKAAVPMLTFSESALRFARLLSILRFNYGALNKRTFECLITNTTFSESTIPSSIDSLATKAEIASIALKAVPINDGDNSMEPLDSLTILAGIASILSTLGYYRKKAFIVRELITILLPILIQDRKDSAAELGYHPAASLSSSELAAELLNVSGVTQNLETGDTDIVSFLDTLCDIYGVVRSKSYKTQCRPTEHVRHVEITRACVDKITVQAKIRSYGNTALKMDVLRWCINTCEALPDLEGMLKYSSNLLTTASTGLAPEPDSHDAYPTMSIEDQARSYNTIMRAADAAKQLGINQEAEYWDEFLVRDIEIMAASIVNPPTLRRKHELLAAAGSDSDKKVGPFIYNPLTIKSTPFVSESTLHLDNETTFIILLQNLFDVELDIEWLKLETSNDAIESMTGGLIIGPYRTQKVYLKGRPKVICHTKITSCTAKVRGCIEKTFPIFKAPWRPKEDSKLKTLGVQAGLSGEDCPMVDDTSKDSIPANHGLIAVTIPISIIEDQPLVVLKSTTLTQSAIMVLVGQIRQFEITLENTSQKEIDFLLISFIDSNAEILRSAVENKDTLPSDLFEIEYSAYRRPAFKLASPDMGELMIPPKGQLTLTIDVLGKPGLQNGSVQITYSNLGVPRNEVEDEFYTRQIIVPVAITVNASVDLIRAEILPYNSVITSLSQSQPNATVAVRGSGELSGRQLDDVLNELKSQHLGEDRCFLLLDFFNAWPKPLRVSLEANESEAPNDWDKAYEVQAILQPGNSTRLLMIVPKVALQDPHAPIPIINPANRRQFVLSMNKVSAEIEQIERKAYWYKEIILKNLRATWSEVGGSFGQINLRTMRISPRMIELLKPDVVGIDILVINEDGAVQELNLSHYSVSIDVFVTVTVRIRNRGTKPIHPILRLQPSLRHQAYNIALDLSRKIAFNGLLQRVLPVLEPDAVFDTNLGILFLCSGEYEIGASLEELRSFGTTVERTDHHTDKPRIWYSKSPCLVDVS